MISKIPVLNFVHKSVHYAGFAAMAYAGYAGLVYMAWTDIKPWSGVAPCRDECGIFCGCSYLATLYNETIFLVGKSSSWAVLPYLGHVFPGLS